MSEQSKTPAKRPGRYIDKRADSVTSSHVLAVSEQTKTSAEGKGYHVDEPTDIDPVPHETPRITFEHFSVDDRALVVTPTMNMGHIINHYLEQTGLKNMTFLIDGESINRNKTVEMMDIKDGDTIMVYYGQETPHDEQALLPPALRRDSGVP